MTKEEIREVLMEVLKHHRDQQCGAFFTVLLLIPQAIVFSWILIKYVGNGCSILPW